MHSPHRQSTPNAQHNYVFLSGDKHPIPDDGRRYRVQRQKSGIARSAINAARELLQLDRALTILPPDLLRTLQRAANSLDLDVNGLTATQIEQRYSALGCQITSDFAARIQREAGAPTASDGDVATAQFNKSDLPITADKNDSACGHHTSVDTAPSVTLRFTEWRCGHRSTLPADIACNSVEQAQQILQAISSAISRPSYARAVLYEQIQCFGNIYITADYVSPIELDTFTWGLRSAVYCLTAEQFALLQTPALASAYKHMFGSAPALWDGTTHPEDSEVVTLLSCSEVEAVCRPLEWLEEGTRTVVCDAPPVIHSGDWLLEDVRDTAAYMANKGG